MKRNGVHPLTVFLESASVHELPLLVTILINTMDKLDEALGSSREKTSPRKRIRVDPKKASISKLAPDQSTSSSSSVYTQPPPASVACARTEEPSERIQDPFLCSLRCKNDPDSRHHQVLWWHSPVPPIPLAVEMGLIGVLVPYQKREHGLFRDQPTHRIRQLQRLCESKDIALSTALSLRRHHMKRWNPNLGMSQLRLGSDDDIRESARLFEEAVHDYLRRSNVAFYAESEQKAHIRKHRQSGQPYPPTPDFILKEPIRIKTYVRGQGNDRRVIQERSICCTYWKIAVRAMCITALYLSISSSQCSTDKKILTPLSYGRLCMQGSKSKCSTGRQRLNTMVEVPSVV